MPAILQKPVQAVPGVYPDPDERGTAGAAHRALPRRQHLPPLTLQAQSFLHRAFQVV